MSATLDLARQLLACPSVTPDDAGCQRLIGERLAAIYPDRARKQAVWPGRLIPFSDRYDNNLKTPPDSRLRRRSPALWAKLVPEKGEPTSVRRTGDIFKNAQRGSLSGKLTVKDRQGHIAHLPAGD